MSVDDPLVASCHCGGVTITLPGPPDYIGECNCSICARTGGRFGYYDPAEVEIKAETELVAYIRDDMDPPALALHHCQRCGCTTHWTPMPGQKQDRMGVNMRLVEDGLLDGVEIRQINGKSW